MADRPDGEILIESGHSPSGTYHLGHLRELITCDAITSELAGRGRNARHISFVDDLDALRKVPVNVPPEYEKYLGRSLCDIPAPDGSSQSYANFFLQDLIICADALNMKVDFELSHKKYKAGFFTKAIEKSLDNVDEIRGAIESASTRRLDENWSPIQVSEEGYLKKRPFVSIDKESKTIKYLDKDAQEQNVKYDAGLVKLDWRLDWPARWWLLDVAIEPFGRDHATKGGSYDTGAAIAAQVFGNQPPLPVPYDFVNMAGDTKKMSASKGTGIDAVSVVRILPPEIVRYFMLRFPPSKRLYFDPINGAVQLIDEFAELMTTQPNSPLLEACRRGLNPVVSRVPFTHLVASYQSALKDADATIEIIKRTGYEVEQNEQILKEELEYIDQWLEHWAPEDVKFSLRESADADEFLDIDKKFLKDLADKVEQAPTDADGEWFHKAIYEFKDSLGLEPKELFTVLYKTLIGKTSGPRAGWFLSILPRDWLIKRLRLEQ